MKLSELESLWGLTEITMIRLPCNVWASAEEQVLLAEIASTMPEHWSEQMSAVARNSQGFRQWLRGLSSHSWSPTNEMQVTRRDRITRIDFSLPWCARLRWGARVAGSVDVFVYATGVAPDLPWETI
jgi:hypothetical protein